MGVSEGCWLILSSKQCFILYAHYKFKATVFTWPCLIIVYTCDVILGPKCFSLDTNLLSLVPSLFLIFDVIMKARCISYYAASIYYMRSGHILFWILTLLHLSSKSIKTIYKNFLPKIIPTKSRIL